MIKKIISDLSGVILFTRDRNFNGTLNGLYKKIKSEKKSFDFYDYFEFNEKLLRFYNDLKKDYSLNIYTLGSIQNNSAEVKNKLTPIFDNIYSAHELNLPKTDPNSYLALANKLNCKPTEIIFIDDNVSNLEVATQVGLKTVQFADTDSTISKLKELISL